MNTDNSKPSAINLAPSGSKTMTPRTDALCDEFADNCKNPPFHYIVKHARELERELNFCHDALKAHCRLRVVKGKPSTTPRKTNDVAAMPNVKAEPPAINRVVKPMANFDLL
jgi:hypothetical protein